MARRTAGFTMIELIVVIVILGILAAMALPRFIDVRGEATDASAAGVSGAAGSAMSLNYGGCSATNHTVSTDKCVQISACTQVGALMQGGVPSGYTIAASGAALGTTNGATGDCTVTNGASVATFTGIAAGN